MSVRLILVPRFDLFSHPVGPRVSLLRNAPFHLWGRRITRQRYIYTYKITASVDGGLGPGTFLVPNKEDWGRD